MKIVRQLAAAMCLAGFAGALATPVHAERPQVEDFWTVPDFFQPALSPSGRFIAYVKREGEDQFVVTIDLDAADGDMKSVPVGKVAINDLDWLSDEQLIVSITGYYGRRTNKPISWDEVRQMREDGKVLWRTVKTQAQSIVMNRDGRKTVAMFDGDPMRSQRGWSAQLVYELPSDKNYIIMQAPEDGDLNLYKVSVKNGKAERLENGTEDTGAWFVGPDGEAVLRWDFKYNNRIIHSYAKRSDGSGGERWELVKVGPTDTVAQNGGEAFQPQAPSTEPNKYYVTARPEGAPSVGLYLYDYATDDYGEPLRSDPGRDIEDVDFGRESLALRSVTYSGAKPVTEYLDPNTQAHMDGLQAYFGDDAVINAYATDVSERRWLLAITIPQEARVFYLYDKQTQSPIRLGNPRSSLDGKDLSNMQVVRYTARDGMELFGYLSRPVDAQEGDTPPLVVMPHGGPEARDAYGFDPIAQTLTAAGYQVFQPQFRGSSGLGIAFADAGRGEWGKAMQHDVDDGFDHLVALGLADPNRACLMGFSYGGYAAFAAATLTPEKYQCILAGAGVSDLKRMLRWERDDGGELDFGRPRPGTESFSFKYFSEHIGDLEEDSEAIDAVSPINYVDRITKPMFIFHGDEDRIVPIEQSRVMMAAMDRAGKPYEWYEMKRAGHEYGSSASQSVETLNRVIDFLNRNLPVDG